MKILITGGAGFVGSRLALLYQDKYPEAEIRVLDNLKRRGSEMNLALFKERGIHFLHGDIRSSYDFQGLSGWNPDLFLECSAEPSVHAGLGEDPRYLLDTNLMGTINCLEYARRQCGFFVFLSTSRVYPIPDLRAIPLKSGSTRFELADEKFPSGLSPAGISEEFSLRQFRSLYGCTKLCSELIVAEYIAGMGLKGVINRCGVIAGAGQFGKVDQGVFTLWVARHVYRKSLRYTGFGGTGLQVRDLLHPKDLFTLLEKQLSSANLVCGETYNAGGGMQGAVSLQELTELCQELTGQSIPIHSDPETASVDIPWYVTDSTKAEKELGWKPETDARATISDISSWLLQNRDSLKSLFC